MRSKTPIVYVPALRLKKGERDGLKRLEPDVADRIAPRLVVPPSKERDANDVSRDDVVYGIGRRIGADWPMRRAFLDVHFLFQELGEESTSWLPRIFEVARSAGTLPIPVATLSNILGQLGGAFELALAPESDVRIAIRVKSGEIDRELAGRIAASMSQLRITPKDCALILDFADADLSDVEAVSMIALDALERVQRSASGDKWFFKEPTTPKAIQRHTTAPLPCLETSGSPGEL